MDYLKMTAPCGKDCFNCPLYIGEENMENRLQFLERNHLSEDQFRCPGCRENNGYCPGLPILGIDPHCKTFECVREKNVTFCFECPEFPCERLQPLADHAERVPHALKVFNLCMIQKKGVEVWGRDHSRKIFQRYYTGKLNDCM